MPLPLENEAWPPAEWTPAFDQIASNDVWFTGSESALAAFYGAGDSNRGDDPRSHYNNGPGTGVSRARRVWRAITKPFWGRLNDSASTSGTVTPQQRSSLHSPLAGNLATLSSDLLFAEPPTHRLMLNGDPVDGDAQERFDEIVNSDSSHMILSQGGEWAAGLGGTVLTAHWDRTNSDKPWMQVTPCDAAVPEYDGPKTVAINLWTTYPVLNASGVVAEVYTHVERHEIGAIVHALYKGTQSKIGTVVPMDVTADAVPALAGLRGIPGIVGAQVDERGVVTLPTGITVLTAQYWRNLPTRLFRKSGLLSRLGRADFEGIEPILSEVDAVWSSWMRDIKIARARLIVPDSYLEGGNGLGASFDDDAEILTALNYADGGASKTGDTITAHQFEIRFQEHAQTILSLVKEVLQHAGYSLSSYGEYGENAAKTATEVVDRTTGTERTRDKKFLYFVQAAVPLDEALLELDRVHYNGPGLPAGAKVVIEFPEVSQVDPEKEARTMQLLRAAQAASTRTLVRMQHEDWDQDEEDAEVARILAENGLVEEERDPETDPTLLDRVAPPAVDPITGLPLPDPEPVLTE